MSFTTTLTTKNQLTLPKTVRDRLCVKKGIKFDIYPTPDGFIGRLKRRSRILDFAGDLNHLDNGKGLPEIREETQRLAGVEINKKISPKK